MSAPYDNFAPFYDLEYSHKDDDIPFYLNLAKEYGSPILEIGVGTGRLAIPLAQEGHTVWGIDNSIEMIRILNKKSKKLSSDNRERLLFTVQDMRSFHLQKKFSLVIMPFRAFLHNLTMKDQVDTLRSIRNHLHKNGLLAFDMFVPLYSVMTQSRWQEKIDGEELSDPESNIHINCRIVHEPAKQLLTIRNTYYRKKAWLKSNIMHYRYIFRYEMEMLLKHAGFQVIDVFGGFQKQKYNYFSGIMIFTAKGCI
jgi:SAM-dependent methyltransferase